MSEGELSAVFADIPHVLGVPFLNLIFHRLAQWPDLLIELWAKSRHIILTREFARAATTLAGIAIPAWPVHSIEQPPSMTAEAWRRAQQLTDAYRAVQPQLLLLVAGWAASPNDGVQMAPAMVTSSLTTRPAPGRAYLGADVPMISTVPDDPTVALLFEQMIVQRGHPGVSSYYRSMALWPPLLQAVWDLLQPRVLIGPYVQQVERLASAATAAASVLKIQPVQSMSHYGGNTTSLRMLESWRDVQVPQLMLDTALVEAAIACP